jgi:hypothetical protein
MIPPPQALTLTLCDRVIIEQGTKNPTLVGIFLARKMDAFPSEPASFSAFVPLIDGSGTGTIELVTVRLATDEHVYSQKGQINFPHRFAVINAHFRINKIRFPEPGPYAFMILVDGDLITQRRVDVY